MVDPEPVPSEPAPETEGGGGPGYKSSWSKMIDRVGDWMAAILAWLAVVLVFVFVVWKFGWLPLGFTLALSGWTTLIIWWAVKVYYQHILEVDFDPSGKRDLVIQPYSVPLEKWPDIEITGPKGLVHDRKGTEFKIVQTFDPDTLKGKGAWSPDWDQLRLVLWVPFAHKMLKIAEGLVMNHAFARIRAQSDLMADRDTLAREKDFRYMIIDPNSEETLKDQMSALEAGAKKARDASKARFKERHSNPNNAE